MDNASLPYLKSIADALKGISGGVTGGGTAKITASNISASASVNTTDIVENLDLALMTDFSEESSQLRISALAMLKSSLVAELRSAMFVTVSSEQKSVFELIHDQLDDLKQYHIREILGHLSLQTVGEGTQDEHQVLVSDISFASQYGITAGGVEAAGGGGGGGGSLELLNDVAINSKETGDVLVYDRNSSHWKNVPLRLTTLLDVDGTPSDGKVLTYNSSLGKWVPGTAAVGSVTSVGLSMPLGFNVSNTPITGSDTFIVEFAQGYSLFQDSVLDPIRAIINHLSLVTLDEGTQNERVVLVSDIAFASQYSITAGGVEASSGGGGGGSLEGLNDVSITSKDTGDVLVYDRNSSHWKNKQLSIANLVDVTGTPGNGQALIYNSSTGKWEPGSVTAGSVTSVGISMPLGFNVSNSPVTSNGTLTVEYANGYSLFHASLLDPIMEILNHLSLVVLDEGTANERTVLVSDIAFASELSISAGGVAASGGGGGGSSTLAGLVDTTITDPEEHQMLVYDSTSHWVNVTPSLSMLRGDVYINSTPSNGQVLKYNSTLGKWAPAADAGGIASVSLSQGTNNGTLALTVDGTTTDNIPVRGLGSFAFISSLAFSSLTGKPTTISGYGITDAKFGTAGSDYVPITLGSTTKNVLTSHQSLSGYATQTWVTNRGYLDSVPAATDSAYGGFKTGYSESGKNYAVQLSSGKAYVNVPWTDTVYTHPTGGANKTISAANGKVLSAITVDSLGHVTSVDSKTLAAADIPDLSGTYLPLTGGTLTGDLRLKNSGNYGLTLLFGDGTNAYLTEDTDDHLKMYGKNGITLITTSSSYAVAIGSSGTATPLTVYGETTAYGNLTVGAQDSTSSCKTLTLYGRTSSSYPALTIYGVASSSTRYSTSIYRDSSYLQITSGVQVTGNILASGAVTAGSASDRRLKKDIRDITLDDAEKILSALHPVSFRWNGEAERLSDYQMSGEARGFIADEFLELLPNAGRKIWGDYDALYYEQAIPYLVAGWKQQNLRVRILESEIKTLKEDNEILRRRLKSNNVLQ